ncbi:ABC transporter substrate-binding protein [Bacillus tianshenii]|nr:ABC transporter substrate-binding protein [Bacillus tianshenii]
MKKLLTIFSMLLLLVLAACGSEETSAPSEAQGEDSTLLDEIKERGKITVAMGGKYPPFNYINEENELVGFDVDIAKEIAKRLGVEMEPVTTDWDAIITGLLTEKYDIILGSMSITPERQQKADFVQYYTSGAAIIVPEDSSIKGKEDLKGKTVGVGLGTTYEEKAREIGSEVKTYKSSVEAFTDMINGRIDAVISDKLLSAYGIKKKNYPFEIVGDHLFVDECGVALRKESNELEKEIQSIIKEMQEDGTYTEISEKWFGMDIR